MSGRGLLMPALVAGLLLAGPAGAATRLDPATVAALRFTDRTGSSLPLAAAFRDASGAEVRLGRYFDRKPVLLVLEYLRCPNLCGLVLEQLAAALRDAGLAAGRDFELVAVGIDPAEGPDTARAAQADYARRFPGAGGPVSWHFLTGGADAIDAVAGAVGFPFRRDPETGQIAHPAGLVIAGADGRVAGYVPGTSYEAGPLRLALLAAAGGTPLETAGAQLLLLCFHYDPVTGRHTPIVLRLVTVACIVTALALGAGVGGALWRERRRGG